MINVDGDQKNGICASFPLYRRQNQCEESPVIKIGTYGAILSDIVCTI